MIRGQQCTAGATCRLLGLRLQRHVHMYVRLARHLHLRSASRSAGCRQAGARTAACDATREKPGALVAASAGRGRRARPQPTAAAQQAQQRFEDSTRELPEAQSRAAALVAHGEAPPSATPSVLVRADRFAYSRWAPPPPHRPAEARRQQLCGAGGRQLGLDRRRCPPLAARSLPVPPQHDCR